MTAKPKNSGIIIYGKPGSGNYFKTHCSRGARYGTALSKTEKARLEIVKDIVADIVGHNTKH